MRTRQVMETQEMTFEAALDRLQHLVKRMETGQLPLEEALKAFEEGVTLTRICQTHLAAAEQKVEILTRVTSEGKAETQPFQKS